MISVRIYEQIMQAIKVLLENNHKKKIIILIGVNDMLKLKFLLRIRLNITLW